MNKLLKYYTHSANYRHTIIGGIIGLFLGLSAFLAFNPSVRIGLLSDITGTIPSTSIDGEIGYSVSSSKLIIVSNQNRDNIKSIDITLTNSPEIEILLKSPSTNSDNIKIQKMGPSMTKYSISTTSIKKGQTIATFSHNGSTQDIVLGNAEIHSDEGIRSLSISNTTP